MMLLMPENRARVTYLQVLRGRLSTARGAFSASTLTALRIASVQTPTCLATSRSVPGRPGWHLKSSHRVRRYVQIRPKTFPLYGVNRGPPHHPCFCSITRDLNTRDGKHELPLCSCSGRRRRNFRFGRVGRFSSWRTFQKILEKDRDKLGEDDVSFRTRSTYPLWLERCATAVNHVT